MLHLLDLGTRKFWRLTGRPVDLTGSEQWLDAPMSASSRVGTAWVAEEAARHGGPAPSVEDGAGLLPSMAALDGPDFDSARLRPEVRDFYEHTSAWRMEVWSGWSPLFWPGGEASSRPPSSVTLGRRKTWTLPDSSGNATCTLGPDARGSAPTE